MRTSDKRDTALQAYTNRAVYTSFEKFKQEFDATTQVAEYCHNDMPVDLLYAPRKESKRLAVFFNSQQKAGELRLFTWQKVSKEFLANRLFIADSTVSVNQDLNLGWYVGSRDENLQSHIFDLVSYISDKTQAEEIIFFGSSGGGYPAILYSQRFNESVAVTLAPTTTIKNHSNRKLVNSWLQQAHDEDVLETDMPNETILDIPSIYSGTLKNPVIILQNKEDTDFIETQTKPFAEALGLEIYDDRINGPSLFARFEAYGSGHMPPPSERITRLAKAVSNIPLGNLRGADYKSLLDATK